MSVVTFPRRVETRRRVRPEVVPQHATARTRRSLWRARPVGVKATILVGVALVVVMAANSYVAERQVQLHSMQSELLQMQAQYATQLEAITNMATPARVAAQAGRLHLAVPTSVTQVTPVPLTTRLPLVRLRGDDVVTSRTYR